MVNEIIRMQVKEGLIENMDEDAAVENFNKAIGKGLLKIMNKIESQHYIPIADLRYLKLLDLIQNLSKSIFLIRLLELKVWII